MVSGQQGKLRSELFADAVDPAGLLRMQRLVALFRLAVTFKYAEELEALPDLLIEATSKSLKIALPKSWLAQHPLTHQELKQQKEALKRLGLRLTLS